MALILSVVAVGLVLVSDAVAGGRRQPPQSPNIVFILADDMGWNDVGFHGSSQIPTPNLDALAYGGLILNRYYVTALCTPSRSALMTGRHPIHTGMQHTVLYAAEPRGLSLAERLLPEHLRHLGYATHIVGKWHLGHFRREYTPQQRGFDTHLGYWTGHQDYFDHRAEERGSYGLDMRRGMEVAYDLAGQYTTDVLADESVRLIAAHNRSQPLFLYMAHAAVHSGNPDNPLPAPPDTVAQLADRIADINRRRYAAMMVHLDRSVGAVVEALRTADMLANTIIVFSTDNGGAADGFNINAASNWPLRGVKNTLWEGGVRGAAFVWSPLLTDGTGGTIGGGGRVSEQRMHIMDWLPTLYRAAGGNLSDLGHHLDGINAWDALVTDTATARTEVLHNIDDVYGNAALTVGDWKLLVGTNYNGQWDSWYGPAGSRSFDMYNVSEVLNSRAARALAAIGRPLPADEADIRALREAATLECTPPSQQLKQSPQPCNLLRPPFHCLYHVTSDPCELNNLADAEPLIVQRLQQRLAEYNATAVAPANLPLDPRANPIYWNGTWTNFGDFVVV